MRYLIGIDVGTSGTKALIINADNGEVIASSTKLYPLYTSKPQWAEQNPEDWWQASVEAIKDIIATSAIDTKDIKAIGLSGQMHSSVFLDSNNQVIRPAILWCDQRTQAECDYITNKVGKQRLIDITCNPVLTGFTAPKIVWLRNNEPENYAKVRKVLLAKDFIRLRLTDEYATEVSDASGTSLCNVPKRCWSDEILETLEIPKDWMPKCYESPEITGRINSSAASITGLCEGTPVIGGGGDNAASAIGNGIVEQGIVSSSLGTSGVVFAYSDKPVVDPKLRVHTFCHAVPDKWHIMGVMLSAGGTLRWYKDTFADAESSVSKQTGNDVYNIICHEASVVPAGSEGLICLPYLTGERTPYPDPNARGVFFGMTLRHSRAYFNRAVLEGVAYGIRDSFEILKEMNVPVSQVRSTGGGAKSDFWRQMHADVSGYNHVVINVDEGPGYGAALLAGVGAEIYSDVIQASKQSIRIVKTSNCNQATKNIYDKYYKVYQSLYKSLKDDFKTISEIY